MRLDEFIPCDACKDSSQPGYIINTRRLSGASIIECRCHRSWRKRSKLKLDLYRSQISLDVLNYSFKDYIGEQSKKNLQYLQIFIDNFRTKTNEYSLYIHGKQGSQKTTLGWIIGREILKKFPEMTVFYVPTMKLLVDQLSTFENQRSEENKKFLKTIVDSDLIIVDECFAHKDHYSITDIKLSNLSTYLKTRLEIHRKSIIFISNVDIDSIDKKGYSRTLESLIKRKTKVFEFKDVIENIENEFDPYDLFN